MTVEEFFTYLFLSACGVPVLGFIILAVSHAIAYSVRQHREEKIREKWQRRAEERRADREEDRKTIRQEFEAEYERKRQEGDAQAQLTLAQAVQQVRDVAEERYRKTLEANGYEELDQRLRESQLIFVRCGRVLTVRGFVSPTGWVRLEWMLDPSLPQPLRVMCKRDERAVFVEYAYRGVYGDILVRGREYNFNFSAYDGERDREKNFGFVVRVPTEAQWQRTVAGTKPVEDGSGREQRILKRIQMLAAEDELWEKARREGHQRIDGSDGSDAEKRKRKATLDMRLLEEREKEDGEQ